MRANISLLSLIIIKKILLYTSSYYLKHQLLIYCFLTRLYYIRQLIIPFLSHIINWGPNQCKPLWYYRYSICFNHFQSLRTDINCEELGNFIQVVYQRVKHNIHCAIFTVKSYFTTVSQYHNPSLGLLFIFVFFLSSFVANKFKFNIWWFRKCLIQTER
jgi:hypothetical protein